MYGVCSHRIATVSIVCDTLYYWWYWTKGGAVLHLDELKAGRIPLHLKNSNYT